ncbi:hypothetical protein ATG_14330 [Desulfurococcaceae archaeon AG1]|nr:hypothetical protein ATG_14330 [Desulfurococcaceae archaeon AG1]
MDIARITTLHNTRDKPWSGEKGEGPRNTVDPHSSLSILGKEDLDKLYRGPINSTGEKTYR